jgi:HD-GYP domain-containing protein (c-di-GMP phosphodiesterase class II)
MTAPGSPNAPARGPAASDVPSDTSSESVIRRTGRQLIYSAFGALRAVKLYPPENAAVQKALVELTNQSREMIATEGELEIRLSGEFIFINQTRLRLALDNFGSFSHLLSVFRTNGVGSVTVAASVTSKQWLVLLSLLQSPGVDDPAVRLAQLAAKLADAGVTAFTLAPPTDSGSEDREHAKERAKRTYTESVSATRELIESIRMGGSPNIKKIKRVVQGIVDQILNEETSLIGLTTIRDYDEYTFTHSVNVCIFSVALGKRLGLSKLQLYDLGMAALFHDIGKSRVPQSILTKTTGLTNDEWPLIAAHPWLGVLALFQVRGAQELPYRAMIVAHEHHMKRDLTGYPRPIRARQLSVFSKIVAIADAFDAATTRRSYQSVPFTPAEVMSELRDNPKRGMDPVIVKAFINLTGVYPVGTLVVLDTFELGIVHAANPLQEMLSRPIVRIISDDQGTLQHPGTLVDLADRNAEGVFARTIIKTDNPDRYGIRIGDYFV